MLADVILKIRDRAMKPTDAKDSPQPNAATIAAMKDAEEGRLYDAASVEDFMRSLRQNAPDISIAPANRRGLADSERY